MKHALRSWKRLEKRLRLAPRLAIFLDFDGTLAPIRSDPDSVRLGTRARALVARLAGSGKAFVAIVTGRSLSDIVKRIGLPQVAIAANHGAEIQFPGRPVLRFFSRRDLDRIRRLQDRVRALSGAIPGLRIENKGPVLAIHFRNVPEHRRPEVFRAFRTAMAPFVPFLKRTRGKMVIEARPRKLPTKYHAVRFLLKGQPRSTLAFYFGDDLTDLDAFRAVRGRGLSIQVGFDTGSPLADFYVNNPAEVLEALRRILRTIGKNKLSLPRAETTMGRQ
jgi:trehalose-phosphatase